MGWNGHKYVPRVKIMSITPSKGHYDSLSLHKDGRQYHKELHRLVAEAFVPNPNNYPQVMHLDEDKHNNKADNLAWGTAKENCNFPLKRQRISQAMKNKTGVKNNFYGKNHTQETKDKLRLYGRKIICEGIEYHTIKECAEFYNVQPATMGAWLRGTNTMPQEWKDKGLRYNE